MIHTATKLAFIGDNVGFGVLATADISKGTVVYVKDSLETLINQAEFEALEDDRRPYVERYSYIDGQGVRVLSWDHARYVNHCCDCNTLTTGYGFEIAIRDICAGEEVTDDYGLLNLARELVLECGEPNCRKVVRASDWDLCSLEWDEKVRAALLEFRKLKQPLLPYIDTETLNSLNYFLDTGNNYKSVVCERWVHGTEEQDPKWPARRYTNGR